MRGRWRSTPDDLVHWNAYGDDGAYPRWAICEEIETSHYVYENGEMAPTERLPVTCIACIAYLDVVEQAQRKDDAAQAKLEEP